MRMLMEVSFPTETFNKETREGRAGQTLNNIIEEVRPESIYFTERDGKRGATLIVNINNPSDIPAKAEPWYLKFNADVRFSIVMNPDDLKNSGLDTLGKKWS